MARTEARIKTSIWSDRDYLTLPSGAQRLFQLVLEQPDLSMCGIAPLTISRWAGMAPDTSVGIVRKAFDLLVTKRFLVADETTEEAWVRSFTKYDGVLRSPNVVVAMSKDFCAIRSEPIRKGFLEGLPEGFPHHVPKESEKPLPEGIWDRFSQGFQDALAELTYARECARGARAESDSSTDSDSASDICLQ